jgi:hypothetical protein
MRFVPVTLAMTDDRPAGIRAIILFCVALAIVSLAYAGLAAAGRVSLSSAAWLLGGGLEQLGPVAFLIYAAVLLVLSLALARRWRWARRTAILVAVAGIALIVPAVSSAVVDSRFFAIGREALQIIVRVMVVFYLSQEPVKDWFASG